MDNKIKLRYGVPTKFELGEIVTVQHPDKHRPSICLISGIAFPGTRAARKLNPDAINPETVYLLLADGLSDSGPIMTESELLAQNPRPFALLPASTSQPA